MWLLTEQQHTQATLCVAVTAAGEGGDGSSEIEAREVPVPFFFNVCHPEVFNTYTNIQWCISKTQRNFIMFGEERETNKIQLIWCLLSNFYLNMFRASLCPSSGEQECALPHMVFCTGSDGCGCVELGCKLYALCLQLASQLHTATAITTSAEHHMRQCTLLFSWWWA